MSNNQKMSFTTQNRLIIFGLVLSTLLIMAIAVFATVNIQKNLNESIRILDKLSLKFWQLKVLK